MKLDRWTPWLFPLMMTVLVAGSVTTTLRDVDYQKWSAEERQKEDEAAQTGGTYDPPSFEERRARAEGREDPLWMSTQVAFLIGLFALADLAWRARQDKVPSWYHRGGIAVWLGTMVAAGLAVHLATAPVTPYHTVGDFISRAVLIPLIAWAIYGSFVVGFALARRFRPNTSPRTFLMLGAGLCAVVALPVITALLALIGQWARDWPSIAAPLWGLAGLSTVLALALSTAPPERELPELATD